MTKKKVRPLDADILAEIERVNAKRSTARNSLMKRLLISGPIVGREKSEPSAAAALWAYADGKTIYVHAAPRCIVCGDPLDPKQHRLECDG